MDDLRKNSRSSHPIIVSIWRSRKINNVCGYPAVTPWTVDQLDEEWTSVFDELATYETKEHNLAQAEANAKTSFENLLVAKRAERGYRNYLR